MDVSRESFCAKFFRRGLTFKYYLPAAFRESDSAFDTFRVSFVIFNVVETT